MFEPYLMGQYQYPRQGMTPAPNWQPQTPQVAQGQTAGILRLATYQDPRLHG